jgi:hypothetical protein
VESDLLEIPVEVDLAIDDGMNEFWKETGSKFASPEKDD